MRIACLLFLSFFIATSAGAWTRTATFEDGTVGSVAQGASGFTYAGSATTFSNTRASSGSKSAKMVWPQCSAECGWGVCHGEIDHADVYNGSQIWLRGYYYFDPGWQFNATHIKILTLRTHDASDNLAGNIRIVNVGSRMYYSNSVIPYANGGDSIEVDTGANLDVGSWQYIEIYLNVSTSNPIVRMWKNGVLIMQDTSNPVIVTGGRVVYSGFMNTWNSPGSPQVQTQYIDDVVVTTDQPSKQDSYGNYMIGSGEYVPPPADTTPPVLSNTYPSGTLTCVSNSMTVTESLNSNEAATVKYHASDVAYDSMGSTFSTTGGTTHSRSVSRACGASYSIYARGMDVAGNKNTSSTLLSYSIAAATPDPPGDPTFIDGTRFGENSGATVHSVCTDTTLNVGFPTTNYSTGTGLNTYTWPVNTSANTAILKFDLSSIPTNAVITDAKLYLYQTHAGGDSAYDVPVHRISGDTPVIASATWNTYDGTNSWGATLGGRGDIEAAESTNSLNTTAGWKVWDVDTMVGVWVATPATNKGMLLDSDALDLGFQNT